MDSKGILSIELLFYSIITIFLILAILPSLEQYLDSNKNFNDNLESRILIDKIANSLNQINSNNYNYSEKLKLPNNISNKSYLIKIKENEVSIEFDNKKGKTNILPTKLVNFQNQSLNEVPLYNGNEYNIKKILINDNKTKIINQSAIQVLKTN